VCVYWCNAYNFPLKYLDAVECDLFVGDWVPDLNGPRYDNESCRVIEDHQNCMRNGRPDSGYLYWRWNPRDCELPKFSPKKFLDMMRDKSWAFIGDSISRNHVQSLLCLLSQVQLIPSANQLQISHAWPFGLSLESTLSVLSSLF